MENKISRRFYQFSKNEKKRFLFVFVVAVLVGIISFIQMYEPNVNPWIIKISIISLIMSLFLSIPPFIAFRDSEKFIKHLYEKGLYEKGFLGRLIFYYSRKTIFIGIAFLFILGFIFISAAQDGHGDSLGFIMMGGYVSSFFVWIVSFVLGLIFIIKKYKSLRGEFLKE